MNEKQKTYFKIIYRDAYDKIQETVQQLPEDIFMEGLDYKSKIDRCVDDIMEVGGFWLNATTIIPSHKIQSFHTHQQNSETKLDVNVKPNLKRNRRGKRGKRANGENTLPTNNKISQDSSSPRA